MRRYRGLSLIELLIALALLALSATLAMPSFTATLERQRVKAALFQLGSQFAVARNTAITQRRVVSLCPSQGGLACRSDSDWSRGWMMYAGRRRSPQPEGPASVLRVVTDPVHRSVRLQASQGRRALHFLPSGLSGGSNIRVRACLHGRLRGEIVVNNLGRVRTRQLPGTQACTANAPPDQG